MAKKKSAKKASSSKKKLNLKMSESSSDLLYNVADLSSGHITYGQHVAVRIDKENHKIITRCP